MISRSESSNGEGRNETAPRAMTATALEGVLSYPLGGMSLRLTALR